MLIISTQLVLAMVGIYNIRIIFVVSVDFFVVIITSIIIIQIGINKKFIQLLESQTYGLNIY